MAFTLDTKLGDLLDHPQAKAILDKHIPGVSANPMIAMARGMSLKTILSLPQAAGLQLSEEGINLNSAVTEFEKALILQSLEKAKWVKNKAAKLLKLNRTTLVEKIKRYQLDSLDSPADMVGGKT